MAKRPKTTVVHVEAHRVCGLCRGVGERYSKQARKRYYKCVRCGHTWSYVLSHAEADAEDDPARAEHPASNPSTTLPESGNPASEKRRAED